MLLEGCRSVEIDVWDGRDGEPNVTHGNTACTTCKLRAVLAALAETAFVASVLPVFVSIEMHCRKEQQQRAASLMREVLGSMLLMPSDVEDLVSEGGGEHALTPRSLARKICIKGKMPKQPTDAARTSAGGGGTRSSSSKLSAVAPEMSRGVSTASLDADDDDDDDDDDGDLAEMTEFQRESTRDRKILREQSIDRLSEKSEKIERISKKKKKKKGRYVDPEMVSVTTVRLSRDRRTHGARGLAPKAGHISQDLPLSRRTIVPTDSASDLTTTLLASWQVRSCTLDFILEERPLAWPLPITSISEKDILGLTSQDAVVVETLQQSTQRRLARCYPRGTRIGSSNMLPLDAWRAGAHMVALNYQVALAGTQTRAVDHAPTTNASVASRACGGRPMTSQSSSIVHSSKRRAGVATSSSHLGCSRPPRSGRRSKSARCAARRSSCSHCTSCPSARRLARSTSRTTPMSTSSTTHRNRPRLRASRVPR